MHYMIGFSWLLCSLFIFTHSSLSGAEEINSGSYIVLGQSCALSGPAKNLGLEIRAGLIAAFSKMNDEGGVKGREILLRSRDDGYEPDRAVQNTEELIREDQVFLLIGEVGTPTSEAVLPLIEQYRVPFFAPFSGAEFLRTPFRKYVINLRASYYQETEHLVSHLVDVQNLKKIACFYQNDSYGFSGLEGIEIALAKRGLRLSSYGSYERNTIAVTGALEDIYQASPEAIILVGAYAACAEFIKLSKTKKNPALPFYNISFVGAENLKKALGTYGSNVIISQVVPYPPATDLPLVREYMAAMAKYQHDAPISFVSFEGYMAGKLFCLIAMAVEGELTREKFITTMETVGEFDLGGLALTFAADDHQGMDAVYLTRIEPNIKKLMPKNKSETKKNKAPCNQSQGL